MSYGYGVKKGSVEFGESNVIMRSASGSQRIIAGVLGVERDEQGKIVSAVLDSLVHDKYQTGYGDYEASGCYVTELTLKK